MAEKAADIVHIAAHTMQFLVTPPPTDARNMLETEDAKLVNPGVVIGTYQAKQMLNTRNPQIIYPDDLKEQTKLFSRIKQLGNQIKLPKTIKIDRNMYLRRSAGSRGGWLSTTQQLQDYGYHSHHGTFHVVNFVMAFLTGFHNLLTSKGQTARLTYTKGRDVLLSSLFLSIAKVQKSNKKILDYILR